jgi:hypothetical protein
MAQSKKADLHYLLDGLEHNKFLTLKNGLTPNL